MKHKKNYWEAEFDLTFSLREGIKKMRFFFGDIQDGVNFLSVLFLLSPKSV